MEEEINEEPMTLEEYKKIGEALKNTKKYLHIFAHLIVAAPLDITNLNMKLDEIQKADSDIINLGYDIGRQMEEDFPEELEIAYDLFF